MPTNKLEVRNLKHEVRASGDGHITGCASTFNTPYDVGWFTEMIAPNAFDRSLASSPDVRCFFNHDFNIILGRTKSKTLTLRADATGLLYDCTPPTNPMAAHVIEAISRGDIDASSFGFICRKDIWALTYDADGNITGELRTILDADLMDVSPVTFPANPSTSVGIRSLWPDGMPPEVRSRRGKRNDMCGCDCPECQDGECDDCSNADCDDENCRCMGNRGARRPKDKPAGGAPVSDPLPTKLVDGEELPVDAFLVAGDRNDPKTWKLAIRFSDKVKTQSHLRDALGRWSGLDIEKNANDRAWRTLVRACREADVKVNEKTASRWKLTDGEFRDLTSDAADQADCFAACQSAGHQIKINVEEIMGAIARAVEDPKGTVSSIADEFREIISLAQDALEECTENPSEVPSEAERAGLAARELASARARLVAIDAA